MTELKTLKDIDNHETNQIVKYISILQKADCFRPSKEKKEVIAWLTHQMKLFDLIKQEAIKWVKTAQLIKEGELIDVREEIKILLSNKKNDICNDLIFIFKHFFNITEEDLK